MGRIRFKFSQAAESDWEPEDKPIQEKIININRLLLSLITLLNHETNPQAAVRLAAFEQQFVSDLRDQWELLRLNYHGAFNPPRLADLPQNVRERFISPEGQYLIRIFPSQDIWNPKPLGQFVRDLRGVNPDVVGDPVLLYVFTLAFRNACLWAAGVSLIGIALLVSFLLRSLWLTILALIPLIVGTSLTLGLMWLLEVPFNQANVLFLPLILGEAVEYGIIILVRWQQEKSARVITLPAGTAKGVLLAALTTAVGFGSLMISGHRGTFSLGLLSAVGSLSVLLAALSVLPALLRLVRERYPEPNRL
jgi:predicted RND superfamily exporter protein